MSMEEVLNALGDEANQIDTSNDMIWDIEKNGLTFWFWFDSGTMLYCNIYKDGMF